MRQFSMSRDKFIVENADFFVATADGQFSGAASAVKSKIEAIYFLLMYKLQG